MLPDHVFFNPTPAFIAWLDRQKARVIDAGAGVGLLGALRPEKVVCFDINERENPRCEVYPIDTTTFPYPAGDIVLMARPSGGDWIHETWRRTLERGARVFYAGLAKNYARDLEGATFKLVLPAAGEDGEELFEITAAPTTVKLQQAHYDRADSARRDRL